jgi:hypothetical protein
VMKVALTPGVPLPALRTQVTAGAFA